MPTRANRDTNSYAMKVGNGAQAPHTEIEDRICLNIYRKHARFHLMVSACVVIVIGDNLGGRPSGSVVGVGCLSS